MNDLTYEKMLETTGKKIQHNNKKEDVNDLNVLSLLTKMNALGPKICDIDWTGIWNSFG